MQESQSYDLTGLLRISEINVHEISDNKTAFTVGEYFDLASEVCSAEKAVLNALAGFAEKRADENDHTCLSKLADSLESLGSARLAKSLIEIQQSGNGMDIASFATEYSGLCKCISHARINRKTVSTGFSLPSRTAKLKTIISRMEHEEKTRKLRVMAVDDTAIMLNTISAVLSDTYKVIPLNKPTLLEKVLQKLTPELFLLDYKMPELSGFDLIPIIRSFKEHQNTPIIILTAVGTVNNISAAIALGACDFIVKPFEPQVLRERIARHIVRKSLF